MKRSICSQLTLILLFVLQSQQLHPLLQALEYSLEERIYIANSLADEQARALKPQLEDGHHYGEQYINQKHHQQQYRASQDPHHRAQLSSPQSYPKHPNSQDLQQQQHHHFYHQHHHQQQQPQPQGQTQQQHDESQQQSLANTMQQVLLDGSTQRYHYARTRIEWKHESTSHGELNEIYMHNYESSYPVITQDQLIYHHYQHDSQQERQQQYHHISQYEHLMYEKQINDDHYYDTIYRPIETCATQDPSLLIQPNLENEPTCAATSPAASAPDSSSNVPNLSQLTNKPSHNSNIETFPITPHSYQYESSLMSAIRHYWREVSGLCLASAIFLNWLFVLVKRRFISSGLSRTDHAIESIHQATARSISKDTNTSSAHDSAFDETAPTISLEDIDDSKSSSNQKDRSSISVQDFNNSSVTRQRSSTLKAEPIAIPSSGVQNPTSTSLSNSLNTSEYLSRYSSDFDSIQRLGRGGFGIVFEARNKIDDCHYAVKRICLPLEKEARERVMREVRALAKLDHAGIVRYYNAWLETPPDDWLKQHDAQLGIVHSKDGLSCPSTDGIYERNESEQMTRASKLGESGDNSSGLFGNSPFNRRTNGYRRFLKNTSSSPSLDIVFEGSGSIRLESANPTEGTDLSNKGVELKDSGLQEEGKSDDNNSDSEDSDFIQFESKSKQEDNKKKNGDQDIEGDEFSVSSHLTDPFSSSGSSTSSSSNSEDYENPLVDSIGKMNLKARKNALNYQKELRLLNNASLKDNLHAEKVYLYIQMQLCRKDTLKDWLKTNCENRDKSTIFDLFYQIVDAVEYVHSQDLIHRDLKPSNIFFSLDGTLKIGDFGLCRAKTSVGIGSSLDLQEYVAESDVERSFEAVHTEQVGTQLYMSPEQLNGLSYNQKVDIFAMGLILLELLVPFKTQMQRVNVLFKARNNLYSDEFKIDHPQEHELVKALLSRSPLKRPTASEIKQHELLASAQLSQPVIERIYHRRRTISSNSSTE